MTFLTSNQTYTVSAQEPIDFSPQRWQLIQHVLGIFAKVASDLSNAGLYPHGLEVLSKSGEGFPRIRILHEEARIELLSAVAREICENGLPGLSVWKLPQQARTVLFRFLTDSFMEEAETAPLRDTTFGKVSIKSGLLLLRGFFSGGILTFAFAYKRWRFNYGLHLIRTRLAVP
ncbi:unnamed protein product [Diplocarpon coronariae]|nr:hypothetical protein JHW43_003472 [Diplocarpon mali]